MLKRILLLCTIIASLNAKAQFTIDEDTLYAYGFAASSSSGFADISNHTVVRSGSLGLERIKWIRTDNTLHDTNWTSAVCDIVSCRGSEVDTGSFVIGNMDTGILSFHFYPKNVRGNGTMTVKFYRESNPLEFVNVVIFCTAWTESSLARLSSDLMKVYPNPSVSELTISHPVIQVGSVEILDASGKLVASKGYVAGSVLDISSLESGVYTLRLVGENGIAFKQFIKN